MYGMDIKLKLKATQKNSEKTKKNWGIYNLNSIIISLVLRIFASQNRYDEILNIRRVVIPFFLSNFDEILHTVLFHQKCLNSFTRYC